MTRKELWTALIHAQMAGGYLTVRTVSRCARERANITSHSSSAIGERLKSSSATVRPTEADSEYLVETALVLAESLGGDSRPVLSAWMTRSATWSMSKFQERKPNSASESLGESSDAGQE